ncbi:oxygen regulatory protein NreC [Bacteroidia bacterium]|nr:oxygen regulatory protein NreC [Bacteroidia bacterium]GHV70900.1 oxygen regulatory protein NreC [Bacteroidia bacterium]
MIDVHIVDDHKVVVEGFSRIINESDIAIVTAIYYSLSACREGLAIIRPDVLLLDVSLEDGNGVDFCAEITAVYPDLKIMMLTGFKEFAIAKRSLHNGALGYVLKNAMPEEIIAGIQVVNSGETFLCEEIDVLIKKKKKEDIIWLTVREKEVLQLIAEGWADPEIAEKIFLSRETVKGYRKDLLLKFNAKNSVALVKAAIEQKLI